MPSKPTQAAPATQPAPATAPPNGPSGGIKPAGTFAPLANQFTKRSLAQHMQNAVPTAGVGLHRPGQLLSPGVAEPFGDADRLRRAALRQQMGSASPHGDLGIEPWSPPGSAPQDSFGRDLWKSAMKSGMDAFEPTPGGPNLEPLPRVRPDNKTMTGMPLEGAAIDRMQRQLAKKWPGTPTVDTGPQQFGTVAPDINPDQFVSENYARKGTKGVSRLDDAGGFGSALGSFGGFGGASGGMGTIGGSQDLVALIAQILSQTEGGPIRGR